MSLNSLPDIIKAAMVSVNNVIAVWTPMTVGAQVLGDVADGDVHVRTRIAGDELAESERQYQLPRRPLLNGDLLHHAVTYLPICLWAPSPLSSVRSCSGPMRRSAGMAPAGSAVMSSCLVCAAGGVIGVAAAYSDA